MHKVARKYLSVLLFALCVLAPSLILIGGTTAATTCPGSLPLNTGWTVAGGQIAAGEIGHISQAFSTLRAKPGEAGVNIHAPATFIVSVDSTAGLYTGLTSACHSDGLLYVHVTYITGGTGSGWASVSGTDPYYGQGEWLAPGAAPAVPTPAPTLPATPTAIAPTTVPPTAPPATPSAPVACTADNTPFSLPTRFETVTASSGGRIVDVYSTLRPYPGAPDSISQHVYAPSNFAVRGTQAIGGFCWLHIDYGGAIGSGWALESQRYGFYGLSGYWLEPNTN